MKKNKKPSKFKRKLALARSLAIKFNSESFTVDGKKYRLEGGRYEIESKN
tara:strand:- start:1092 stop:1241 length:150 start_codon:yes stop_codon:yes gene_type:complete